LNSAVIPGDGGTPGRFRLSAACDTMRSRRGNALTSEFVSAPASRFVARNCPLTLSKSDTGSSRA